MGSKQSSVTKRSEGAEGSPEPLLTLRATVILMASLIISGITGILTYLESASLPEACLAAGPACAAAVMLLNVIIG
jgi:hypothetical protein